MAHPRSGQMPPTTNQLTCFYKMKFNIKVVIASAIVSCGLAPLSKATVTINFYAGDLRSSTGTLMPVGGLLELVADTSRNGFSTPTSSTFVSGDDAVIATFALNGNLTGNGVNGQTANTLAITPGNFTGLDAEDPLIFRWFPNLTTTSTTPGIGTMYGQFNTTTNQDGANLPTPWAEPADGGSYTLTFVTTSEGGSNANSLGYATSTVIPEPSSNALFGCGLLSLIGLRMWSRRPARRA